MNRLVRSIFAAGWATLLTMSLAVSYTATLSYSLGWRPSFLLFVACCLAAIGSLCLLLKLWRMP